MPVELDEACSSFSRVYGLIAYTQKKSYHRLPDRSKKTGKIHQKLAVLFLVAIFTQPLFPLVRCDFMSLSFTSAGHMKLSILV